MNLKILWEHLSDPEYVHVLIRGVMIKALTVVALAVLALPFPTLGADGLSRDEVVTVVLRDNPRLKASRAKWQAMTMRLPQARAWEDPMIGVDVERKGTTQFTTFSDNEWMASQEIPVTGKNLVRGRIADAEALVAFEELRRVELDAVSRAKAAYVRVAGAYGQLEINLRNEALSKQFSEIARVKYEAGTQTQSEVLIAQTDLARVGETRAQIERELSDQQTQLNVLMDRPPSSPLGRPDRLAFTPLAISRNKIEAVALTKRPEVILARRRVEAEKARRDLAKRQWIPDPRLRVEARQFNGSSGINEYDTGIFFSVPWPNYRKYSAGVSEAGKNLEMAESELQAARSEVLGMVRDQLKKIDTSADNYRRFAEKIVPLAAQAVQATRSSYESDETSFLELVTARRTSEEVESALLRYLIEHEAAVVELDAVIGNTNTSVQSGK